MILVFDTIDKLRVQTELNPGEKSVVDFECVLVAEQAKRGAAI